MKAKRVYLIILAILLLIGVLVFARFVLGGDEDNWIKDSQGVWIKHGNPSKTPNEALEKQGILLLKIRMACFMTV